MIRIILVQNESPNIKIGIILLFDLVRFFFFFLTSRFSNSKTSSQNVFDAYLHSNIDVII